MSKDKQEVNKDDQWWAPVVGDQELRLWAWGARHEAPPTQEVIVFTLNHQLRGGEVSPDWKGVVGRGGGIRPGPAQVALVVKNLPANAGDVRDGFHPWVGRGTWGGGGMITHSSILAWRIPWTEEPGGLQSLESQRVRHD